MSVKSVTLGAAGLSGKDIKNIGERGLDDRLIAINAWADTAYGLAANLALLERRRLTHNSIYVAAPARRASAAGTPLPPASTCTSDISSPPQKWRLSLIARTILAYLLDGSVSCKESIPCSIRTYA
jgi:hypothetical protein